MKLKSIITAACLIIGCVINAQIPTPKVQWIKEVQNFGKRKTGLWQIPQARKVVFDSLGNIYSLFNIGDSLRLTNGVYRKSDGYNTVLTKINKSNASNAWAYPFKSIDSNMSLTDIVITNNNQLLTVGDFISIALEDKLAARAVVAKIHQGQVGVKILKIYSMAQWTRLRRDQEVQIIRGDDSQFEKQAIPQAPSENKIKNEDDLYTGDVMIEDDLSVFDENKNRHIKPDNLVGLHGTYLDAAEIASQGSNRRSMMIGLSWGYQFADNYYVEGVYSRASFNDFPNEGKSTVVNNLVGRLKYNIKGPLYTYFQPYVGFRMQSVSSPDAGKTADLSIAAQEDEAISKL